MAIRVALAGFGSEGLSAYNYFTKQGADITIFDEAAEPKQQVPKGAKFIYGPGCFAQLADFDKVVRFPGIRPDRIQTDGELTSNIKEFFAASPTRNIIGVTGTKGKGTIATLIRDILQAADIQTYLAGNIGLPALDILGQVRPKDVVVLELSSFQLWDLTQSPHIAVVGMIEPEHLDVHSDFEEYTKAKANITRWQTADDIVVYHPTNDYSRRIALLSNGTLLRYGTSDGAHVEGDSLVIGDVEICKVADVQIPGEHNIDNICAAITAAWQYTQDAEAVKKAVAAYGGLEHRLELVKEVHGVKVFNDSISTTPGSALAALRSFDPAHEILIIGGSHDKGADFGELAAEIAATNPKKVLFIGSMGLKAYKLAEEAGYKGGELYEEWDLRGIVHRAVGTARKGDVVLFSPATASFGDFASYQERGQQFKEIVQKL